MTGDCLVNSTGLNAFQSFEFLRMNFVRFLNGQVPQWPWMTTKNIYTHQIIFVRVLFGSTEVRTTYILLPKLQVSDTLQDFKT